MRDPAGDAPRVDLPRQLARRLFPAAVAVVALIAVVAPALIWYAQVGAARQNAEIYAHDFERHLQAFVLENGPLWRYQAQKYVETLRRFVPDKDIRRIVITDERGEPMPLLQYVAEPTPGEWPNHPVAVSVPVRFNNRVVAGIVLEVSTEHATENAVRLSVVFGITGLTIGLFMFALPVSVARRLDRRVQREMQARTALYVAAEQHLEQTRRLAVLTREVASTLDPQEAAARVASSTEALFDAHAVRLWQISREEPNTPIPVVGAARATDAPRVAAVLAAGETRREALPEGGERWIVPLIAGQEAAGALEFTMAAVADAAEAELVGLFASKVAIALVNCDLHEAMRHALKRVTEQNAELDSFVHTVSHDLKAPLIAIRGFVSALDDSLPPDRDAGITHYVKRITTNVDHMTNLLHDMLDLSQVGRSQRPADTVSLDEVVCEVLGDLQADIEARGVAVTVGALGEAWGVRSEIHSVFQNLIGNAVKYMGDTPSPRVWIGRRKRDGVLEYFVQDNGIGIDPAYHDKVFRLFERLHDVQASGTGVGLAIVRRIVERAGGQMQLESERGHGATFSFTWPRPTSPTPFAPVAAAR